MLTKLQEQIMALVFTPPTYLPTATSCTKKYNSLTLPSNKTNRPPSNQWIYISSIIYLFALGLYKSTILLLYLRLFGVNKKFNRTTRAVLIFVITYLLSNLLTLAFGCVPISKFWDQSFQGHCISEQKAGVVYGSLNVVTDVVIFVLPLPMVWRLQLSRESKLGVTLVFMGGVM